MAAEEAIARQAALLEEKEALLKKSAEAAAASAQVGRNEIGKKNSRFSYTPWTTYYTLKRCTAFSTESVVYYNRRIFL